MIDLGNAQILRWSLNLRTEPGEILEISYFPHQYRPLLEQALGNQDAGGAKLPARESTAARPRKADNSIRLSVLR